MPELQAVVYENCEEKVRTIVELFEGGATMGEAVAVLATSLAMLTLDTSDQQFGHLATSFAITAEAARDRMKIADIMSGGGTQG